MYFFMQKICYNNVVLQVRVLSIRITIQNLFISEISIITVYTIHNIYMPTVRDRDNFKGKYIPPLPPYGLPRPGTHRRPRCPPPQSAGPQHPIPAYSALKTRMNILIHNFFQFSVFFYENSLEHLKN